MGLADLSPEVADRPMAAPEGFRDHVLDWSGWPRQLERNRTRQIDNVSEVIWRMVGAVDPSMRFTFRRAKVHRARIVRAEDPALGRGYAKTVHKNCVTDLGYRKDAGFEDPLESFIREAQRVIAAWNSGID